MTTKAKHEKTGGKTGKNRKNGETEKTRESGKPGSVLLALLCVLLCLLCLAVTAWFVKTTPPAESNAALLSGEDDGRLVAVSGVLAAPRVNAFGFSGLVCSSRCVSFFIPRAIANEISAYSVDLNSLQSGARLRVEGVARENTGAPNSANAVEVELEVASARGVELLS